MSIKRDAIWLACALFCLAASARAQEPKTALYGRVVGSDQGGEVPAGWVVRVTAKREGTGETLDQRDSSRELYCVRVPANARVRLFFETTFRPTPNHLGYGSTRLGFVIDTAPSDRHDVYRALPDVTLQQTVQRIGANVRADAHDDLDADVAVARETGSLDILNVKVLRHRAAYHGNPQVLFDIDKTTNEIGNMPEFRHQMLQNDQRLKLLRDFEIWKQGSAPAPGTKTLLLLAQDGAVFSAIRSEAALALASQQAASGPVAGDEVLKFFRGLAASPGMLLPAFTALAEIGTADDKLKIVESVKNADPERALAAIAAIGDAKMTEGTAALADLLHAEVNQMLDQSATKSLAKLAQGGNRAAITSLKEAAVQGKIPAVRIGAVEALIAVMSVDPNARLVVEEVGKKDASAEVRQAANALLQRDRP
jgi:hypothetical protein